MSAFITSILQTCVADQISVQQNLFCVVIFGSIVLQSFYFFSNLKLGKNIILFFCFNRVIQQFTLGIIIAMDNCMVKLLYDSKCPHK